MMGCAGRRSFSPSPRYRDVDGYEIVVQIDALELGSPLWTDVKLDGSGRITKGAIVRPGTPVGRFLSMM